MSAPTGLRLKAALVALMMMLAFAGAAAWKPSRFLADEQGKLDLEAVFPRSFGEWRIDERVPVQLVSPDLQAQLNALYNQTLSRTYVNGAGDRIMLSVAYGGDQSDATRTHLPEVCYPAQGFSIDGKRVDTVTTPMHDIRVRRMVGRLGTRVEPITYWLTIGTRVATSGTEMKLAQLSFSTRGVIPDGMLVRVSSIDADTARAYRTHAGFIASMVVALPAPTLDRVIGVGGH